MPTPTPEDSASFRLSALHVVAGCLFFGLLRTLSFFAESAWRGLPDESLPVWAIVGLCFLLWLSWAPFVPLVAAGVRRFPLTEAPVGRHILAHAALFAIVTPLRGLLRMALEGPWLLLAGHNILDDQSFGRHMMDMIVGEGYSDLTLYCMIVAALTALDVYRRQAAAREALVRARRAAVEARLHALEGQLNPHFLFNALNAISAFVERDARGARRLMADLAEVLRFTLHHTQDQQVRLADEIAVLERYLALEHARYDDQVAVEIRVDAALDDVRVPALLLQPLVENAIRHGLRTRVGPGRLRVLVRRQGARVHICVQDDGVGLPDGWTPEGLPGVGLRNTRERLRLLYGDAHAFRIENAEGGGTRVEIELPGAPAHRAGRRAPNSHEVAP